MTNEITVRNSSIQPMSADRLAANLEALLSSLSANTRAQIASTWKLYSAYCASAGVDVWQLDAVQAIGFFTAHPARPSTQRARLSHLRTVLGLHADTSGDANLQFSAALLQRFKLPNDADSPLYAERRKRREKRALLGEEVYDELHRQWATPQLTSRNRAIIALLFYAALRRSEVCKLRWSDINLAENTIAIRGAKKRTADHVDIVPLLPTARAYLLDWRGHCPEGRQVVFCAISKAGKLLSDKPLSGEKIRLICGAEFMPHDARRTLGTRSIENGTPTNYTQKILRHASATMTLKYAEYIESKHLVDKVKLGY
jgi:integrase